MNSNETIKWFAELADADLDESKCKAFCQFLVGYLYYPYEDKEREKLATLIRNHMNDYLK